MVGLVLALLAGVVGASAVPAVLRTGVVAVALYAVCGYTPAKLLVRRQLPDAWPLMVLPLGAVFSSIPLAVLGLLHVPLKLSLAIVITLALVAVIRFRPRGPRVKPNRARLEQMVIALLLAGMVALVSLIPIFRSGFATVPGQNGDAILVVGSATLVEHAPPTATRLDLPINRIPLQWRSKYPIYYALAAVSTLAGQTPIQAFATVSALMLALTALGLFLFARYALRAPPALALLTAFLVPLDRIVMYVTVHPYYNELWGQFTLPFILLSGWLYLTQPGRRNAVLFVCFVVLGLLAYPLMLPFPLFFLLAGGWVLWRRRDGSPGWISGLRITRPRMSAWIWVPIAVVIAVPVGFVLVRGFFEKTLSALAVIAPWRSLAGWHGTALDFLPWPRFVGMPGSTWLDYVGLAVVCVLAASPSGACAPTPAGHWRRWRSPLRSWACTSACAPEESCSSSRIWPSWVPTCCCWRSWRSVAG